MDQRAIGERKDVLKFATPVLQAPVEVTGRVTVELWAESDAPDTDFMAKLVDIYPDGSERLVLDSAIRARFREGFDHEVFMKKGEVYKLKIDLWSTSVIFNKDNRIEIHASSWNEPRVDPNADTCRTLASARQRRDIARRPFMATTMGSATCFLAQNKIFASKVWDVDEIETWESAPTAEKFPKSEYFIIDCQSHFTNGLAIGGFRNAEFVKNMGFQLKNDSEAYGFKNFVKEMFFDSETMMVVISGVPGREILRDKEGKVLVDMERTPGTSGKILPSWLMSKARKEINDLAGSQRALNHGNLAPN